MLFDSFLGNERLKEIFSSKLRDGTLSHAYLFVGADGMGKSTFVSRVVKALCCTSSGERPCGECAACKKYELSAHPDVHRLCLKPDESSIRVDDVRKFISTIELTPNECDYKIYVIEDAHTMGREAQNAILKTLEEPMGNAVFFLMAANESTILPTVRSRCTVFYMEPVAEELLTKHLMQKTGTDEASARKAAKLSMGSVGAAINILQGKGFALQRQSAEAALGFMTSGDKTGLTAHLISKTNCTKDKLISVYGLVQLAMRDLAAREYGIKDPSFFLSEKELTECARKFTRAKAIALYDLLEAEKEELSRNGNPSLSVLRLADLI